MQQSRSSEVISDLLRLMLVRKGSDLYITAGFPPAIKIDGQLTKVAAQILTPEQTLALAHSVMTSTQRTTFERSSEANFSISVPDVGRFRVSSFMQQGQVGMVFRVIPKRVPTMDELGLAQVLKDVALKKRGLCIVAGATGSGKSTTQAAMLDWRNEHTHGHIMMLEDPIEYVHQHKNCIITQREIGVDTESWEVAIKNTFRQAPDAVLIGEIRDRTTMEHALTFAETGHLCFVTLHANNANQAIERIINLFPEDQRARVLMDLSLNLRCMVSQRLIASQDGKGRVVALELLLNTLRISDLIFKGEISEIKEAMKLSRAEGMQTFDQSLYDLYEAEKISYEEALRNADSINDLRLEIKLRSQRSKTVDLSEGTEHIQIL